MHQEVKGQTSEGQGRGLYWEGKVTLGEQGSYCEGKGLT